MSVDSKQESHSNACLWNHQINILHCRQCEFFVRGGLEATGGAITRHFTERRKFRRCKRWEEFEQLLFSQSLASLTVIVAGIPDKHKTLVSVFACDWVPSWKTFEKLFFQWNLLTGKPMQEEVDAQRQSYSTKQARVLREAHECFQEGIW